jgi:hypothetical protein
MRTVLSAELTRAAREGMLALEECGRSAYSHQGPLRLGAR